MGTWYDAKLVYGIEYNFDDIKHLKEVLLELAESIGTTMLAI